MTSATNARIAGSTYLLYIAAGVAELVLFGRATNAESMVAKLERIAQNASDVHMAAVLGLLTCFAALVLGVTLYAVTRVEDEDLAILALSCRVGEGILNALGPLTVLGLLWLATADMGLRTPRWARFFSRSAAGARPSAQLSSRWAAPSSPICSSAAG